MPVVSLDVHKKSCTYAVLQWEEVLDGPKRIPTQRDALTNLAKTFPQYMFVFEATAVHEWIHDVLKSAGANVFVYKPYRRESRKNKNDAKDAIRGGMKYQVGELKQVHVPGMEVRVVRDQVRDRCFQAEVQTQFKNHIHGYLNQKDPARERVPRDVEGSTVFTKRGREAVLRVYPALTASYASYDAIHRQLRVADKALERLIPELRPVQRMTSIPGIGTITGLALYVEIVDPKRFRSVEAVVSYFGLDPIKDQSGDSQVDKHRISKEGRAYVRGLLCQAAWTHVTKCPESDKSRKYYDSVKAKGKQNAITATARRLLRTAFTLWKEDRDFTLNGPAVHSPAGARASV